MVISNGLAEDTELHYTHSLYSEEPFLVIRAKKEKKRERVTGGASEHIDRYISLIKEMLQIRGKGGSYLDTDIIICYDNNLHTVLRER